MMLKKAGLRPLNIFEGKKSKKDQIRIKPDDPEYITYKKKIETAESKMSERTKQKSPFAKAFGGDAIKTDDQKLVDKNLSISNSKNDSSSIQLNEGGVISRRSPIL